MQNNNNKNRDFVEKMQKSGLRLTNIRIKIFELLQKSNKPLSIQDIAKNIEDAHFVSIYRSVDALYKANILNMVPKGFKSLFELSEIFKPHHHHITCEKCGKISILTDERLELLINQATSIAGYKPTRHHLEVYGICKNCLGL